MAKRPLNHQLEDKSRAKFKLILPSPWVFRDITPDYGVDGEAEIFDNDNKSTGLSFLVQLKATQDKSKKKRLRVSLTKEQILYYRKRQPPVLIVRYDDVEDLVYCRWAGQIDLYNSKPNTKSLSIHFIDSEVWGKNTPESLVDDLERCLKVQQGQVRSPISAKLTVTPEVSVKFPEAAIRSNIGVNIKGDMKSVLLLAPDSKESFDIEVVLSSTEITAHIGNQTTCSIHNIEISSETLSTDIPQAILTSIAASFSYLGQHGLASGVILDGFAFSLSDLPSNIALLMIKPLFISGHFEHAMKISENCFLGEEEWPMEIVFRMAAMKFASRLTPEKKKALEKYLFNRLEQAVKGGDKFSIGVAHYNLANHLRQNDQNSRSIFHYKCAAKNAPSYLDKSYFYREIAGSLFHGNRFYMASIFYAKAIEVFETGNHEDELLLNALYADALMFAGFYKKSLEIAESIISESSAHFAEWTLKSFILSHIVNECGLSEQKRVPKEARKLSDFSGSQTFEEKMTIFDAAFQKDALCSLAWFNYGVSHSQLSLEFDHERWIDAYAGYLTAALTQTNDIDSWVNTILCSLNHNMLWGQISLISEHAYFCMGDEFLAAINNEILTRMPGDKATDLLNHIQSSAFKSVSKRKDSTVFRFLDDSGKVAHKINKPPD